MKRIEVMSAKELLGYVLDEGGRWDITDDYGGFDDSAERAIYARWNELKGR